MVTTCLTQCNRTDNIQSFYLHIKYFIELQCLFYMFTNLNKSCRFFCRFTKGGVQPEALTSHKLRLLLTLVEGHRTIAGPDLLWNHLPQPLNPISHKIDVGSTSFRWQFFFFLSLVHCSVDLEQRSWCSQIRKLLQAVLKKATVLASSRQLL